MLTTSSDVELATDAVMMLQNRSMGAMMGCLDRFGVSFAQYQALRFLSVTRKSVMCDLAAYVGSTAAAVTGLIDRMTKLDLVSRVQNSKDRREIELWVTKKGAGVLTAIRMEMMRQVEQFLAPLTETERKAAVKMLGKALV